MPYSRGECGDFTSVQLRSIVCSIDSLQNKWISGASQVAGQRGRLLDQWQECGGEEGTFF